MPGNAMYCKRRILSQLKDESYNLDAAFSGRQSSNVDEVLEDSCLAMRRKRKVTRGLKMFKVMTKLGCPLHLTTSHRKKAAICWFQVSAPSPARLRRSRSNRPLR